jgi:hypothetical protein
VGERLLIKEMKRVSERERERKRETDRQADIE